MDSRLRGNDGAGRPAPPTGYCLKASMTAALCPYPSGLRIKPAMTVWSVGAGLDSCFSKHQTLFYLPLLPHFYRIFDVPLNPIAIV